MPRPSSSKFSTNGQEYQNLYLSNRTAVPINVAAKRMNVPEEIKNGTNNPRSRVTVFSGFGNRVGDNVASSKPSTYSTIQISRSNTPTLFISTAIINIIS